MVNEVKELGRVLKAEVGFGGYQDIEFGVHFTLGGRNWQTGYMIKLAGPVPDNKIGEWQIAYNRAFEEISHLLHNADVKAISDIAGKPIQAVFEDNRLKSFRILTEVL